MCANPGVSLAQTLALRPSVGPGGCIWNGLPGAAAAFALRAVLREARNLAPALPLERKGRDLVSETNLGERLILVKRNLRREEGVCAQGLSEE